MSNHVLRVAVAAFLLAGCGDGPITSIDNGRDPSGRQCATHTDTTLPFCSVWTAAEGPYVLTASIELDTLRIEAGTVVRAGNGVRLTVDMLTVEGTQAEPVIFEPLQNGGTWAGVSGPQSGGIAAGAADVTHARFDGAETALHFQTLHASDVHVTRTRSDALITYWPSTLERVTIEHAGGWGALLLGSAVVTDIVIRNSGGGIRTGLRATLRVDGGSIEDNAGVGIASAFSFHTGSTVVFDGPVRITRNGGPPLQVPLSSLRGVLSDSAAMMMLTGNARDSLVLFAGPTWGSQHYSGGPVVLRGELPSRVVTECNVAGIGGIVMKPGAALLVDGYRCGPGPLLHTMPQFESTEDAPATFGGSGLVLRVPRADAYSLRHARLHGIVIVSDSVPVLLEDVELDGVALHLTAPGSRVNGVLSRRGGDAGDHLHPRRAALTLGDDAIVEHTIIEESRTEGVSVRGGNVSIRSCTIMFSAGHGILIESGSASINGCNLESNTGNGVHNAIPTLIDATDNWWGSALGPKSGGGDGVDGPVTVDPWSTAPYSITTQLRPRPFHSGPAARP